MSVEDVEDQLVLGPGWLTRFENGTTEPSLGMLVALLKVYDQSFEAFFAGLDQGYPEYALDRHLVLEQSGPNLNLRFPVGPHQAVVEIPNADMRDTLGMLQTFRRNLSGALALGRRR